MRISELRAAAVTRPPDPRPAPGWGLLMAALCTAVAAAVLGGWVWSALSRPGTAARLATAPPAASQGSSMTVVPGSDAAAWAEVIADLDDRRSAAFVAGDPLALAAVYASGSSALLEERRRLDQMRAAGLTARGLRHTVEEARVADVQPGMVVLSVRDELSAYELVTARGDIVLRRPARSAREWLITLVPAESPDGEWRISDITPVSASRDR